MNTNSGINKTGRRKSARARITLKEGSGAIVVNGRKFEDYFKTEALRGYICQPLAVTGKVGKVDVSATISGGGSAGQAGALRHGISRALLQLDESVKAALKANGMLTRDSREKERKKAGQRGARRRFQFSKR